MKSRAKPTEDEARSIFRSCSIIIQNESYPFWSGDPRAPKPSRFAEKDQKQPKPRSFRPIDVWILHAQPFSPRRPHFLADGPYTFFRVHLELIASRIANLETERNRREADAVDAFRQAIVGVASALNQLSEFYDPRSDGPTNTIFQRVARNGVIGQLYPEIHGIEAVEWLESHWNKFHDSMEHLLGDKSAEAVSCLQAMASKGRKTIRLQEGPGVKRAFWRHDFVSGLAHLWWNVYGSLPGSNPDNPFVGMVEASWLTALECIHEKPENFLTGTPITIDDSRRHRFQEMNWERTVRDSLAVMRRDIQYKSIP